MWLIGRSLTHLCAAITAYKRVLPPLANYYTVTFGQFGLVVVPGVVAVVRREFAVQTNRFRHLVVVTRLSV